LPTSLLTTALLTATLLTTATPGRWALGAGNPAGRQWGGAAELLQTAKLLAEVL
jgi:hypothetical protein